MSDANRTRFTSTPDDLLEIVRPFVRHAAWLRYDEAEEVRKAKVIPKAILAHAPMLKELIQVQKNLSFTKSATMKMFATILNESTFDIDDRDDWVKTMSKRFRCLCHATHSATMRGRSPAWAAELPWVDKEQKPQTKRSRKTIAEKEEVVVAKSSKDEETEDDYFYGFSQEVLKGWRVPASGGAKELCDRLEEPDQPQNTDGI